MASPPAPEPGPVPTQVLVCCNNMSIRPASVGKTSVGTISAVIIKLININKHEHYVLPESAKYRLKFFQPMLADMMVVLEQTITDDNIIDRMGEISAKTVMADVCRADYHSLCSDTFMMKIMISNNNFKLCCVFFCVLQNWPYADPCVEKSSRGDSTFIKTALNRAVWVSTVEQQNESSISQYAKIQPTRPKMSKSYFLIVS